MAARGTQGEKGVHIQVGDTYTQEILHLDLVSWAQAWGAGQGTKLQYLGPPSSTIRSLFELKRSKNKTGNLLQSWLI